MNGKKKKIESNSDFKGGKIIRKKSEKANSLKSRIGLISSLKKNLSERQKLCARARALERQNERPDPA